MGRVERARKDKTGALFNQIKAHETLYNAAKRYNERGGQRPDEAAVRTAVTELEKIDYELGKMLKIGGDAGRIKPSRTIISVYINQLKRAIGQLSL